MSVSFEYLTGSTGHCKYALTMAGAPHDITRPLSEEDARGLFFLMGDVLGYRYEPTSVPKAKPAEPTPQARQDIAATATLHGMGHIWDGEKWKAPQLVLVSGVGQDFDLVDSLRDQGKLDQKWTMGRIAGEQQERKRCYSIIDRAIAANTPNVNASDSIFHHMQGAQHALLQVRKEITDPTL